MSIDSLPFFGNAAIRDLALTPAEVRSALLQIYELNHAGRVVSQPKLSLPLGPGHMFQAMCAACEDLGLAAVKWLGVAPRAAGDTTPGIHALLVVNDFASGAPLAVMDANSLTGMRTAAMSAVAAGFLARPDSRSIGFVGCGLQAHAHLEAMHDLFPGMTTVLCNSRSVQSARRLADRAEALGMKAEVRSSPEEVVRGSDIVITSVPMSRDLKPFLDPDWIAPGAFVSAVDLGRSWKPEGLGGLDCLATEERGNPPRKSELTLSWTADLTELAAGSRPGRASAADRSMFLFQGHAMADLAIAALAWRSLSRRAA